MNFVTVYGPAVTTEVIGPFNDDVSACAFVKEHVGPYLSSTWAGGEVNIAGLISPQEYIDSITDEQENE